MLQFNQIRQRFLANARQHLLVSDTTASKRYRACCLNSHVSRPIATPSRSGKTEA